MKTPLFASRKRSAALLFALCAAAALCAASPARAVVTTVYNNLAANPSFTFPNGGATTAAPTSRTLADDINFVSGAAGLSIGSISFSAYNGNSTAVTFTPTLIFYQTNGANGGPGTELADFTLLPVTIGSAGVAQFTITSGTGFFNIPANNKIWAGIYYSGATADALNNLYQVVYNPTAAGSSQNLFFRSAGPGATGDNPQASALGGLSNTTANFGWAFGAIGTPAPEPSSIALTALLGAGGVVALARRRTAAR